MRLAHRHQEEPSDDMTHLVTLPVRSIMVFIRAVIMHLIMRTLGTHATITIERCVVIEGHAMQKRSNRVDVILDY